MSTWLRRGIGFGAKLGVLLSLIVSLLISFPALLTQTQTADALGAGLSISANDGELSDIPQIAVSGGNVYVTWRDASPGFHQIFFASSLDNGLTFSEPINISNNETGSSLNPQIAASGSNVYVTWQGGSSGSEDIFFTSSTNGVTFSEPVNISDNAGSSLNPQIAASGSDVYVVWQDDTPGNSDILLASSADNFNATNISDNAGFSFGPQIAVSGSDVFVTWSDDSPGNLDILLASSADDFSVTNISDNTGSSLNPQIAASGSDVYVVWQDDTPGNLDILLASSADSFNVTNISSNAGDSSPPQIAASGGNVYVTWSDVSPGSEDIFVASSSDGVSFSPPINVSSNDGVSFLPQMVISTSGNIHVAWADNDIDDSNFEIFLSTSTDGLSFGCPINLSGNLGHSLEPMVVFADSGISTFVVWHNRDPTTSALEVQLQSDIDPLAAAVVANPLDSTSILWGTEVQVSGTVANTAAGDKVVVDWGDGSSDEAALAGCSWGPVFHTYDSSAVSTNPNTLVTRLLAADDTEKDASAVTEINVEKHSTILTLDPIGSVKLGTDVTVTGSITDSSTGLPLAGANITFVGSGATFFSSVLTDVDGLFSLTGLTQNSTQDNLVVEAHYDGDLSYEAAVSESRAYDIADSSAIEFDVVSGSGIHVDLTGFNASIDFDEVTSGGVLFVSECAMTDERFTAIDMCLRISPAIQMFEGSFAIVTVSFAGKAIPAGHSVGEIDIFHQVVSSGGTSTFVDVTLDRDLVSETVSGRVAGLSAFVGGIAAHQPKEVGAHRTQIFLGNDNLVSLRDITNQYNSTETATIGIDKLTYDISEEPIVTVDDANGNVDPAEIDITYAGVMSETSDPLAIWVKLTETSANSNIFKGSFSFTSGDSFPLGGPLKAQSSDTLSLFYTSGASFEAGIDGVTESGLVELSDFAVGSECFTPVGSAVDLRLIDSQLGPDGYFRVKMSYNNTVLGDIDPSALQIAHRGEDLNWKDITVPDGHNPAAKTISGEVSAPGPFTRGLFSLGIDINESCRGGAGGGFGRGLIVDAVASVAAPSTPPPPSSGDSGSGGGGGGSSSPPRLSSPSAATSVQPGDAVSTFAIVPASSGFLGGQVTLNFEQVITSGSITVREELPSTSSGMFDSVAAGHGSITSADGASFRTAGPIFDIVPSTNLQFQGVVEVTIPYSEALARSALGGPLNSEQLASAEGSVRFMHFDGTDWEDLTMSIDPVSNTVTGQVSSFSRLVAAVVDDGTFSSTYFVENPMSRMAIKSQGGNDTGIAFVDAQGTTVTSAKRGSDVTVVTSVKNLQRTSQEYLYIVEIFNSRGIVVDIDTFTGTIDQAQELKLDDASLRGGSEKSAY
ncbi:MAG: hypothetical protein ACREBU_02920, partial [Nitrososphaera sp.]